MKIGIECAFVRVYFNDFNAVKPWSIDFGPGTPEVLVGHLIVEAAMESGINFAADNRIEAKAWFEGTEVHITIDCETNTAVVERTRR